MNLTLTPHTYPYDDDDWVQWCQPEPAINITYLSDCLRIRIWQIRVLHLFLSAHGYTCSIVQSLGCALARWRGIARTFALKSRKFLIRVWHTNLWYWSPLVGSRNTSTTVLSGKKSLLSIFGRTTKSTRSVKWCFVANERNFARQWTGNVVQL